MSVCDLTLDQGSQPLSPQDHIPLMKEKYSAAILEDKFAQFAGINWFSPEVRTMEFTDDMAVGQSFQIRFKDHLSIYEQASVEKVAYTGECPTHLDMPCTGGCPSTPNSWRRCEVLYDNKYISSAKWCVETEKLTYGDLDERFQVSMKAAQEIQGINSWSQFICQSIENPTATMIPTFAESCFATHYVQAGNAKVEAYDYLTKAIAYMKRLYGQRFDNEFVTFAHPNFELDILDATSTLHNYQNTGIPTAWGNVDVLVQGGWKPMPSLPGGLWGNKILIAPDGIDLYDGPTNHHPFMNEDGSKYYVVIASKRSFFTGVTSLMDMREFPATCDNPYEALKQTWLGFNKLLFPNEVFVLEFDATLCL